MLNNKNIGVRGLLAVAIFIVGYLSIPEKAPAATANTAAPTFLAVPLSPTTKFPPRRAPLAPPVINDVSRVYEFRTQLLGNPPCQRFATESDSVFLNNSIDDTQKTAKLKAIGAEAKANNCLSPSAIH
jgi:hypothetical protein